MSKRITLISFMEQSELLKIHKILNNLDFKICKVLEDITFNMLAKLVEKLIKIQAIVWRKAKIIDFKL